MPPQCGIKCACRWKLGSAGHAHRNWRFDVCNENACAADANYAFDAIVDTLESEPLLTPPRPPSTSSPDGVSAISAELQSAENLCVKLLSAFKSLTASDDLTANYFPHRRVCFSTIFFQFALVFVNSSENELRSSAFSFRIINNI